MKILVSLDEFEGLMKIFFSLAPIQPSRPSPTAVSLKSISCDLLMLVNSLYLKSCSAETHEFDGWLQNLQASL